LFYGAAFQQGIGAGESYWDEAVEIALGPGGGVWRATDAGPPSGLPMTLRDGLSYSKNTITAQLMQRVGPEPVATLAQAMGVRQSKLEQVPSLALGTSPVTLKEMVVSYSTIANEGRYIEPVLVTRVEDRNGVVLEQFGTAPPEQALASDAALTLLDVLRGVITRGTGAAIRQRFGIQADVAGKTGTTQDNTDGWFILMHPQLVAGAWVGFNDNRITMGDRWGPGARSALPIVGDFYQQVLRAKAIDPAARFGTPPPEPVLPDPWAGQEAQGAPIPLDPGAEASTESGAAPEAAWGATATAVGDSESAPRPAAAAPAREPAPAPAPPRVIIIPRAQAGAPVAERGARIFSVPAGVLSAPSASAPRAERPGSAGAAAGAAPILVQPAPLRAATGRPDAGASDAPAPAQGEAYAPTP